MAGDRQVREERSPPAETAESSPPAQADGPRLVPSAQRIVALQRSAGNAAVARLLSERPQGTGVVESRSAVVARQSPPVADPAKADVMPVPLKVTWATDPFEISLAEQRNFGDDKLEIIVRYTGPHPTTGPSVKDNTKRLTVSVAPKPLTPKMSAGEGTSVEIDLYGDGRKLVRLRGTPSFDKRPQSRGRQHDLDAIVEGRSVYSSSLWVLDPKAGETDIPARVPEEHAGENPAFSMKLGQKTPELRAEIDGDGDQRKELVVTLTAVEHHDDPDYKDLVSKLKVQIGQKSTGQERTATFDVPRSATRGSLFPIVAEVTDGKAPTRISLVIPSNTQFLNIWPGTLNDKEAKYVVSLGDRAINYAFPPDPRGQAPVGENVKTQVAGAIIAWDIRLGAHRDEFRVTVRDRGDGKGAFGITAVNDGEPTGGGMGAEVRLNGPIRGGLVDTGATSVGIDLDGDGKADLQLFDQLTTPSEADGGGPPERQRNHRVRLTGPAVAGDRTFGFQYRHGFLTGGMANPGAADLEADRNAKAVVVMGAQAKQGSFADQVTLLETAMMPMRRKAADAGVLDMKLYNAWASLSQAMVRIEIASMKGEPIDLTQQMGAAGLAIALEDQMNALTLWNDFRAAHMSTYSGNTYTGASRTSVAGGVIEKRGHGYAAAEALRAGKWAPALARYSELVRGLDRWVADRYESSKSVKREDAQEARYMSQLRDQLATMSGKPGVIRPSAVFHPDKKFKDESGYVNAIPLALYCWREGDTWKLKDLTNPAKPYTYSADADPRQSGPPLALFAELDDPDHYPEGLVQFHVPGGIAGTVGVRDRLTWKKFFSYIGLGLAAIGLTLATFGTGTVAVAGVWALTASAVSGAVAAGIDLAEHIQHDNLDSRTAAMDILQIVGGLAGAGALAGGRLAMSAASAPAAARFTGAWARTAAAAQRLSVPLTAITVGSDLIQIGLVAESTARQLDEIEQNKSMSRAEKDRAKALLLSQLALIGGLGALTVKGTIQGFGKGRSLVLSPGPEGMPVASTTVVKESLIIDSNAAIALRKRAAGEPLQEGEKALLKKLDALGGELRIADTTVAEATAKGHAPGPQQGFGISAARESKEYQAVLKELTDVGVGGGKGAVDREIIADAFFAIGEKGVIPRFATMDQKVYKRLYDIRIKTTNEPPLNKLGKQLPEKFPDGFEVTINGRTINVVPLPNK